MIAGIDFPIKHTNIFKVRNNSNTLVRARELTLTATTGFYRYAFNHTGVMLSTFIGMRHLYNNGSFFERLAGIGLLHTFYDGIVYTVADNGTVKPKNNYGRTYATINFALTYGWDFTRNKNPKPFAIQIQPMFWMQFPYNSLLLPHGSLALSIKYHLPNFNVFAKQKQLHKARHI
jgi:hypothetical protein